MSVTNARAYRALGCNQPSLVIAAADVAALELAVAPVDLAVYYSPLVITIPPSFPTSLPLTFLRTRTSIYAKPKFTPAPSATEHRPPHCQHPVPNSSSLNAIKAINTIENPLDTKCCITWEGSNPPRLDPQGEWCTVQHEWKWARFGGASQRFFFGAKGGGGRRCVRFWGLRVRESGEGEETFRSSELEWEEEWGRRSLSELEIL
ncbi:hypothetical protein B0H14DRAFT_3459002 [Mycena olivaceomarginata]|nr:hypothetical protein B0H14DRAFT_3459002 [Mycena olivaceomarginata]